MWENSANLGATELVESDVTPALVQEVTFSWEVRRRSNVLFRLPHCHDFADENPNNYNLILPELRRRYALGSRSYVYREPLDKLHVAVHIRRGDVCSENANTSIRFTSNSEVLDKVRTVQQVLNEWGLAFQVHVLSEGREDDFGELRDIMPRWHLNSCAIEAFDRLVRADILIAAKSSFSYAAALLNSGVIFYDPFWHKPMSHWIVNDERVPKKRLEGALRAALARLLDQRSRERIGASLVGHASLL
jgi:hypothetical protein